MNDATEPARGQLGIGRRFIYRHDPSDLKRFDVLGAFQIKFAFAAAVQKFKLRLVDLQATALPPFFHLAIQRHKLAGLESVAQIFAVKPYALQSGTSLPGDEFKN